MTPAGWYDYWPKNISIICLGYLIATYYYFFQDPEGTLREQFQSFASFGKDRHKDGSHITLSQIDRWFKQAEILDGDTITTTDTAIIFKKVSG